MNNFLRIGGRLINPDSVNYIELPTDRQLAARIFWTQAPTGEPTSLECSADDARAVLNYADTACTSLYPDRIENAAAVTIRRATMTQVAGH